MQNVVQMDFRLASILALAILTILALTASATTFRIGARGVITSVKPSLTQH